MHYLMAVLKQESAAGLCRELGAHTANKLHFTPNSNLHLTILYFSVEHPANENCFADLKLKVDSLIFPRLEVSEIRIGLNQISLIIRKDEHLEQIHRFLSCDIPLVNVLNQEFSAWLPHIIVSDKILRKSDLEKSAISEIFPDQLLETAIEFERILITRKENDRFIPIYDRKLQ